MRWPLGPARALAGRRQWRRESTGSHPLKALRRRPRRLAPVRPCHPAARRASPPPIPAPGMAHDSSHPCPSMSARRDRLTSGPALGPSCRRARGSSKRRGAARKLKALRRRPRRLAPVRPCHPAARRASPPPIPAPGMAHDSSHPCPSMSARRDRLTSGPALGPSCRRARGSSKRRGAARNWRLLRTCTKQRARADLRHGSVQGGAAS